MNHDKIFITGFHKRLITVFVYKNYKSFGWKDVHEKQ